MSHVSISHPTHILKGNISLPASKSISNRALILKAIGNAGIELRNLSTADDTTIMQYALQQTSGEVYVKNAGTCMRFLTAYYASQPGIDIKLTCDPRMELRPIHMLVNALKEIGANIEYLKQDGFPPLHIKGKKLRGGNVTIDAGVSSQFISALMMIAPVCEQELTIELTGNISSQPYIDMTAQMMQQFGFDINLNYPAIHINQSTHQLINRSTYTIEPDWSAASYWYEIAALSNEAEILLEGLSLDSLQGDSVVAKLMEDFGVETEETEAGIFVRKGEEGEKSSGKVFEPQRHKGHKEIHLVDAPDLAPALVVTAAALNMDVTFTGLQNLVIKESNRLLAIKDELIKCGFNVKETHSSLTIIPISFRIPHSEFRIHTYGDHRMAMAFAPLALRLNNITIEHPEVIEKSYPHFWDDLHKTGFNLKS